MSMNWVIGRRVLEVSGSTIVVDDVCWTRCALNLDHHVGHRTPAGWKGEVATEVVMNALGSGLVPHSYRWASIRHYDTDGCLALWSLLNPHLSRDHSDALIAAARYGDFYEAERTGAGLRAVALSSFLQEELPGQSERNGNSSKHDLFSYAFDRIGPLLENADRLASVSAAYLRTFENDCEWLERNERAITDAGPVAIIEGDRELSLGALASCRPNAVVLTARRDAACSQWNYDIILRPRFSWGYAADAVGEVPLRDLGPARRALDRRERTAGGRARWYSSRYDHTAWRLKTTLSLSVLQPETVSSELGSLFQSSGATPKEVHYHANMPR
jgi:hypothetical protein